MINFGMGTPGLSPKNPNLASLESSLRLAVLQLLAKTTIFQEISGLSAKVFFPTY